MISVIAYYIFIFIAGTFIGSFLNLVSDRLINGEPILVGRSHCEKCGKPLKATNLFPIFSFLFQKGKCAFCGEKLSFFYPISEALTGLMFVLAAYLTGVFVSMQVINIIGFFYLIIVFSLLLILFFTDAKYRLLPDVIVWAGIIFIVLFMVIFDAYSLYDLYHKLSGDQFGVYLLKAGYWTQQLMSTLTTLGLYIASSLIIALFFWILVKITKGKGMGVGDIKLGFLIGVFNGFPFNFVAIFLGFVFGAAYSLVLMVLKQKKMKDTIAFGPFLIIGSIVALVFGPQLVQWYFSLIK